MAKNPLKKMPKTLDDLLALHDDVVPSSGKLMLIVLIRRSYEAPLRAEQTYEVDEVSAACGLSVDEGRFAARRLHLLDLADFEGKRIRLINGSEVNGLLRGTDLERAAEDTLKETFTLPPLSDEDGALVAALANDPNAVLRAVTKAAKKRPPLSDDLTSLRERKMIAALSAVGESAPDSSRVIAAKVDDAVAAYAERMRREFGDEAAESPEKVAGEMVDAANAVVLETLAGLGPNSKNDDLRAGLTLAGVTVPEDAKKADMLALLQTTRDTLKSA